MADLATSPVITLDRPKNPGLDYELLRAEGVVLCQTLSGKVWTDYNEHDPGVTSLEQLCYALTELSYRAEMPMASLLSRPDGSIDTRRQALFQARRIFPVNPVTQDDYRRLIVDRVPEVANVWLTPLPPAPPRDIDGLYEIQLYAPGLDPCVCEGHLRPEDLIDRVRRVYCRHRGLCEDVESISLLTPVRAIVRGIVTASDKLPPEDVMASLLFRLSIFLAPEVKREPLSALVARGESPSEIFDGPLPHHGFVLESSLAPKPTRVEYDDVIQVMVSTPGVLSVREITVQIGDQVIRATGQSIDVRKDQIPLLQTGYEPGGKPTLRLFRRGRECTPDPRLVRAGLRMREAEQRRLYPLGPEYEELFPVPAGPYSDLSIYTSIQTQYPACYGINAYGVPEDYPAVRKAQAKQLKGYLLAFEQVLTDYFAQLAHAKDLFSTDKDLDQTYWAQSLQPSVPNVEPLLMDDYERGLQRIVRASDPVVERRNLVSEFLLAMFQEQLDATSVASDACDHSGTGGPGKDVLDARLSLLGLLPASTKNRGRGFDYLAHPSPRNIAGMEIKSRIQLGMPVFSQRPLRDALENAGLDLAETMTEVSASLRQLYIVEHLLLRDSDLPPTSFEYSFTVTAVISTPSEGDTPGFRDLAAQVLRENAPAHVAVDILYLTPLQLLQFEARRRAVLRALRRGDAEERRTASNRLITFLRQHRIQAEEQ